MRETRMALGESLGEQTLGSVVQRWCKANRRIWVFAARRATAWQRGALGFPALHPMMALPSAIGAFGACRSGVKAIRVNRSASAYSVHEHVAPEAINSTRRVL